MKKFIISIAAVSILATTSFADGHSGDQDHHKTPKQDHFSSLDANGNESVSTDEFIEKHKTIFSKIDADGNGELSRKEVKDHHMTKASKKVREKKAKIQADMPSMDGFK